MGTPSVIPCHTASEAVNHEVVVPVNHLYHNLIITIPSSMSKCPQASTINMHQSDYEPMTKPNTKQQPPYPKHQHQACDPCYSIAQSSSPNRCEVNLRQNRSAELGSQNHLRIPGGSRDFSVQCCYVSFQAESGSFLHPTLVNERIFRTSVGASIGEQAGCPAIIHHF